MKKLFLYLGVVALLASCVSEKSTRVSEKHGGTFRLNISDLPHELFPGMVRKASEQLILNQMYVGLVKYDAKTLEVVPSLAHSWSLDPTETSYKFNLNTNAFFHDDACFEKGKGRKIVASDVKFSLEQICANFIGSGNLVSLQFMNIQGSETLDFEAKTNKLQNISGIVVENDSILTINLQEPDKMLIHFLAGANGFIFPREAWEAYGEKSIVGSGPFKMTKNWENLENLVLVANENYFVSQGVTYPLPFLDSLVLSFVTSPPKELYLFEKDKIHMVWGLNESYLTPFLESHIDQFQSDPPYYLMREIYTAGGKTKYTLLRADFKNLELNAQAYFDFSEVFVEPNTKQ